MRRCVLVSLLFLAACHNRSRSDALSADARWTMLRHPDLPDWSMVAPDTFRTAVETSKGTFVIETYRAWAPLGADRFFNFARAGFFDDSRFFRVVPGYIAQFGVPGNPEVTAVWNDRAMRDDPPKQSNVRGTVAYAMRGPNDRRTQIYININDNTKNDRDGFAIFGRVVEGMDVVDRLNAEYGDTSGGGMRAGKQQHLLAEGNAWLDREYPRLDHLIRATVRRR